MLYSDGRGHVLQTRYKLDLLQLAAAPGLFCCSGDSCDVRHNRRPVIDNISHLGLNEAELGGS